MTAGAEQRIRRLERLALVVGLVALAGSIGLGFAAPQGIAPAWRLGLFVCLQPALGSLIFILIYRMTSGQWAEGLAPFLLSGTRLLPWIWILILPLLWFPVAAHPIDTHVPPDAWRHDPAVAAATINATTALQDAFSHESSRHMGTVLEVYLRRSMIVARALIYAVVFFLFVAGARRAMRPHSPAELRWFGPAGFIGLTFLLHLLATDWFILLEPGWYSTGFPLVWMAAQGLAGLAAAVCAALWIGADPAQPGSSERARGLDWGNLLLAAVMSWTYVAFVELLIIWSGNLPAEIAWYRRRSEHGWQWLAVALAVLEFAVPFLLLLSRSLKRRRLALGTISALLLLGQVAYTVWLIAPAFPGLPPGGRWLQAVFAIAAGALFLNRYLAGARSHPVTFAP